MEKPKQQAYVRLEGDESIAAKKDVLSIEMNLLQIITKIAAYKKLRKQEIKDRISLKKILRVMKSHIHEMGENVPIIDKPKLKFIKSSGERGVLEKQKKIKEITYQKGVEEQLAEIKSRLLRLDQS